MAGVEEPIAIRLIHPGISRTKPVPCTLVQTPGRLGNQAEYYMDVDSVFCLDTVCRVVKVRIFWDELGFYDRLILQRGVRLEKGQGEPFTREDYRQLDRVLGNRTTTAWNLDLKNLGAIQVGEGAVDAIAGATVSLDPSQYVVGAAWSCYTLWHWVNGSAHEIIRERTAARLTLSAFTRLLEQGGPNHQEFAVEQLTKQRCHDPETVAAVRQLASTANARLLKPLLHYAESAPANVYYAVIGQLIESQSPAARIKCLDSMLVSTHEPPDDFVSRLTAGIGAVTSYPEINLLLRVLTKAKAASPELRAQGLKLLDNDNLIIARRAYWFLREQDLTDAERTRLDRFQVEHQDVL